MTKRTIVSRTIFSRSTLASILLALMPIAVFSSAQGAQGQEKPQTAQPAPGPERSVLNNLLVLARDDYRIGVGDVLEIIIENAAELSGSFQVRSDGTILNKFLGRVTAQNLTTDELAKSLADGLRGRYLLNPYVKIEVRQYNSRTFFIQGSVNRPGVYQIEGRPSLLELITLAGGLSKEHGSTAYIIRKIKPESAGVENGSEQATSEEKEVAKYEMVRAKISGLMLGDFDQNIPIEPYDVVTIPPMDIFFVGGEVRAPGSYPLKDGTTLRQAISLAQGTTYEAAKSRAVIFRENNGTAQEISVNIDAVMSGKKTDIALRPNDVIIVPNSRAKSIAGALLRGFGLSSIRIPYVYR